MTAKTSVLAMIVGLLLTACARTDMSDPEPQPQYMSRRHEDPCVKPSLVAPEAISVGEGFAATIGLTNECSEPKVVPVHSNNPADLLVITADNMIVWSTYEVNGGTLLLPPALENIQPGEVLEFDVSWEGDNTGKAIPVGTYKLVGLVEIVDVDEDTSGIHKTFEVIKPLTVVP